MKFPRILYLGRDGRIPAGTNVPVTGNGYQGRGAKPNPAKIKMRRAKPRHGEGKHAG